MKKTLVHQNAMDIQRSCMSLQLIKVLQDCNLAYDWPTSISVSTVSATLKHKMWTHPIWWSSVAKMRKSMSYSTICIYSLYHLSIGTCPGYKSSTRRLHPVVDLDTHPPYMVTWCTYLEVTCWASPIQIKKSQTSSSHLISRLWLGKHSSLPVKTWCSH